MAILMGKVLINHGIAATVFSDPCIVFWQCFRYQWFSRSHLCETKPCNVLASALKARQAVVFANSTAFVGMQSESQLFPHFCRFNFLCPCTFTLSYQLCLDETQPRWLSFEQWIPRFKTLDSCPKMAILMGKGSHADHGVLEGFGTAGRNLRHLLSRQYITWNGLFQRCFERRRCSAEALPSWSCPC